MEQVYRLIYASHSRIAPADRDDELDGILTVARERNPEAGITGALLAADDWFVQTLEGDQAAVEDLVDHIKRDRRHDQLAVLKAGPVDGRVFGRWSMARVGEDAGPEITLVLHHEGIAEAAERGTLEPMAEVLLYMRDILVSVSAE